MTRQRIPHTDSIRELAEFWDAHDVTEFEDELEEVGQPVFASKNDAAVRIHLRPSEVAAVRRLAASRGIGPEELIQEWVRQKVQRP